MGHCSNVIFLTFHGNLTAGITLLGRKKKTRFSNMEINYSSLQTNKIHRNRKFEKSVLWLNICLMLMFPFPFYKNMLLKNLVMSVEYISNSLRYTKRYRYFSGFQLRWRLRIIRAGLPKIYSCSILNVELPFLVSYIPLNMFYIIFYPNHL